MHVPKSTGEAVCACRVLALGLGLISGCGALGGQDDSERGRSSLNLAALNLSDAPTHFESDRNNDLASAERVAVGYDPTVIRGELGTTKDVDVYDFGPVLPGDRILVEVAGDGLEAALALFDDTDATLLVNDHRNVYLGRKGPFIDVVIRRPSTSCYVAFAATPGFDTAGEYALIASVRPGESAMGEHPDVVLLDFAGARNVTIGSRSSINVPSFDAAKVLSLYRGKTDEMIERIVRLVRGDFEGYNVTILSTSEGAVYDGTMSRLFFGTYDAALLGVAEGVDEYNTDTRQEAIVFTDTFAAFDRLNASVEEMGQAIANVASHEIGHLLGLVHTSDPAGLMDVTASLSELLRNQAFAFSPIYSAVFPVGDQNAVRMLLDGVGGDPDVAFAKSFQSLEKTVGIPDDGLPPARAEMILGSCGLPHEH